MVVEGVAGGEVIASECTGPFFGEADGGELWFGEDDAKQEAIIDEAWGVREGDVLSCDFTL